MKRRHFLRALSLGLATTAISLPGCGSCESKTDGIALENQ